MSQNPHLLEKKLFGMLLRTYEASTKHELRQLHSYEPDKTIFKQGGNPRGIYFMKSGRAKIVKNSGFLHPTMYRIAGPGEFLGFLSVINQGTYLSSAFTLEASEIWFIANNVFFKTLKEDIGFANGFLKMICQRLQYAEDHIVDLKTKDVRQRLATTLLTLVSPIREEQSSPTVDLMRKDLARIIAATPETLSRQLKNFEKEQLIRISGKEILIENPKKLLSISNLDD